MNIRTARAVLKLLKSAGTPDRYIHVISEDGGKTFHVSVSVGADPTYGGQVFKEKLSKAAAKRLAQKLSLEHYDGAPVLWFHRTGTWPNVKYKKVRMARDLSIRVAMRWILANEAAEYDRMLRAQVLEGAAGVKIGTWWKLGQRGLDQAQKWFMDNGFPVKPEWFAKTYSGMYGILAAAISATARKYGVSLEPLDIIQSSLMGLRADPGAAGHREESPYGAGKALADKIKAGKETPKSVAGGTLKSYMGRRTSDAAKKKLRQLPEGVGGEALEIADTRAEEMEAGKYLIDIMFFNRSDKLGRKIRDLMRKSWAGTGQEAAMNYWMDRAERDGYFPGGQEVGQAVGITPQTFSQRHFKKALRKFFDNLWSDQRLLNEIQTRFQAEGIPWFMNKPDPEEIFKQKSRKAADLMVERVVTRWLDGQTDQEYTRWFGDPSVTHDDWAANWNTLT